MDTIVLKFGGSSVSDNEKLKTVANKIIKLYEENNNIVVIVSAQGKTTDNLISQAKELSQYPNPREMDVLLSVGEQITIAKLSILLNNLGYEAISLTGWQAGIQTSDISQNAIIENIDATRIVENIEKRKIVIIAGFQGVDKNGNITTLGRGGSDTTAVAIASAIKATNCYIYSDVDGIYTADPRKVKNTKKLDNISYEEMLSLSSEGAKVLHNRCVEIAEKYNVPIIAKSTFNDNGQTIVNSKIEGPIVKSLVKKELSRISIIGHGISSNGEILSKTMQVINEYHLEILSLDISRIKISILFKDKVDDKILEDLHDKLIYNL